MKMVAVFGAFLFTSGHLCAQHVIRLGETDSPLANTLQTDSQAETLLMAHFHGGYHGHGYGGYRGYGYGYGGYRGYGYGGYRGYGYGGYSGYGYGYYPGYAYGYSGYGYPSYGYGYGGGYYGYGYPRYYGYGYGYGHHGRYYRLGYTDAPAPAQAPQGQAETYLLSLPKQTTAAVLPVSQPTPSPAAAVPGKYTYRAYGE
jgi:hypothetical protein